MKKMIFILLLFITLTCSVCETFEVRCAQSFYQVFKNENVTLEWTFTKRSVDPLYISCYLMIGFNIFKFLEYDNGVELPLDGPFKGRVQLDKDVLREGRIRLHVSSIRTEDSGDYGCDLDRSKRVDGFCDVTVTEPQTAPETTTEPQTAPEIKSSSQGRNSGTGGRIGLGLGPLAALICACVVIFLHT